ncbi:lysylphosphatidylglycerol synthase domain-containing protein [Euhalothece natronophila]|uniref:lysylphosphatidylglycerol synthase domain-containing protein n=1 Tax=Euhalothece natronophila TaxID=577489 RepID=UPI001FE53912|nr:lysylphosphatidylglycerol synthase domain-containing protein [Euhalothece natronophila]
MKLLRWFILGITLFFLLKTFYDHGQDVLAIELRESHLNYSAIALFVTLFAHIWSGIVWANILYFLQQPASLSWVLPVYLQTNLAKYIPGNVWHFYGRIRAVQATGTDLTTATLSTLLEPLLMATAAVLITLVSIQQSWLKNQENWFYQLLPFLFAGSILILIHPYCFNPALRLVARFKKKATNNASFQIKQYPWFPLLGELTFVGLRGIGFIIIFMGFTNLTLEQFPLLLGVFSLSWFFGLVVPSPGGIGVFESSAIALLGNTFSPEIILSSVALFRLLSLSAEAIAATLAFSFTKLTQN